MSSYEVQTEALLAAYIAVEYGLVRGVFDARDAARYAAQVVDNNRAHAQGHMSLLRGQLRWLRPLPVGSGELRFEVG